MPGIKCCDLGPKMGYNDKDNGCVTFDNVRVPRSHLLAKFVKVDREGNFKTQGDLRILYSIMLRTRA